MTRRPLAMLQRAVADVAEAARRRSRSSRRRSGSEHSGAAPDAPTSDELARRLDETRERLRREIPPPQD